MTRIHNSRYPNGLAAILRAWLTIGDQGDPSWLRALRDTQIGSALARLHAHPGHPWTIESIAAEVAMSRAAFARRFTSLVGEARSPTSPGGG